MLSNPAREGASQVCVLDVRYAICKGVSTRIV